MNKDLRDEVYNIVKDDVDIEFDRIFANDDYYTYRGFEIDHLNSDYEKYDEYKVGMAFFKPEGDKHTHILYIVKKDDGEKDIYLLKRNNCCAKPELVKRYS